MDNLKKNFRKERNLPNLAIIVTFNTVQFSLSTAALLFVIKFTNAVAFSATSSSGQ
jgi:hypothetical protein